MFKMWGLCPHYIMKVNVFVKELPKLNSKYLLGLDSYFKLKTCAACLKVESVFSFQYVSSLKSQEWKSTSKFCH